MKIVPLFCIFLFGVFYKAFPQEKNTKQNTHMIVLVPKRGMLHNRVSVRQNLSHLIRTEVKKICLNDSIYTGNNYLSIVGYGFNNNMLDVIQISDTINNINYGCTYIQRDWNKQIDTLAYYIMNKKFRNTNYPGMWAKESMTLYFLNSQSISVNKTFMLILNYGQPTGKRGYGHEKDWNRDTDKESYEVVKGLNSKCWSIYNYTEPIVSLDTLGFTLELIEVYPVKQQSVNINNMSDIKVNEFKLDFKWYDPFSYMPDNYKSEFIVNFEESPEFDIDSLNVYISDNISVFKPTNQEFVANNLKLSISIPIDSIDTGNANFYLKTWLKYNDDFYNAFVLYPDNENGLAISKKITFQSHSVVWWIIGGLLFFVVMALGVMLYFIMQKKRKKEIERIKEKLNTKNQ